MKIPISNSYTKIHIQMQKFYFQVLIINRCPIIGNYGNSLVKLMFFSSHLGAGLALNLGCGTGSWFRFGSIWKNSDQIHQLQTWFHKDRSIWQWLKLLFLRCRFWFHLGKGLKWRMLFGCHSFIENLQNFKREWKISKNIYIYIMQFPQDMKHLTCTP